MRAAALALAAAPAVSGCEEPLCDGSDDVRWAHAAFLGGRDYEPPFLAQHGRTRITIDGHCRFSLYEAGLRGLRRGVISGNRASRLESELHFGEYSRFASVEVPLCLDDPGGWIADSTASVRTTCVGPDPDIPRAFSDAVRRSQQLALELSAIAEPVWRPVRILPLSEPFLPAEQPIYDWNAPLDLATQALSATINVDDEPSLPGIPVEDAATLARLDELRATDIAAEEATNRGPVERGLFVRDAEGRIFQVLVRDEPSEAVQAAWEELAPR